ncbi:MAG: UDP-N-acetylmuramoyl-L-alanyl-D-glutamate--2,6-diaminopimelate ligase [Candidatus Omnitrophota bacterium]
MRLSQLLNRIEYESSVASLDEIEIKGIACDSKAVSDGYLFIAIAGTKSDGHIFASEAAKRGAVAVVLQKDIDLCARVAKIFVKDTREALAVIASEFYGRPSENMTCVGITGTNGKTTILYLIDSVISAAGHKAGIIGTINYRIGERVIPAINTTPGPAELFSFMSEMRQCSIDYAVMEVSSHSLVQKRVKGIDFSVAVFTNLTGDHLDYHGTLEKYFDAKAMLFEELGGHSCAVINIDDPWGRILLKRAKGKILTYGVTPEADFSAGEIELSLNGTVFAVKTPDGKVKVASSLIGLHNVYNITASIAAGIALGFSLEMIKSGVEAVSAIPGRLEAINAGQSFKVFVDYAHTDDALYNVLSALKPLIKNRIILVFGCGGERDRSKRPRMGKVASEFADLLIITSDNPRGEDPKAIASEIVSGVKTRNYIIILDRLQAIREALSSAQENDCVLIAGKGHEPYQVLKDTTVAFDDRKTARDILCAL